MTFRLGIALRSTQAAAFVTAIGAAGTMKLFSGSAPASCAAADPTGLLATVSLPNPSHTVASGVATRAGNWTTTASASGTVASFRVYNGATVVCQGTVTEIGGGGDATIDNRTLVLAQTLSVLSFTYTSGAP